MEKSFGKGDLVWLDFTPAKGHEQAGKRPAVVLSPREYNDKVGLMIVIPITTKSKKYPFEVPVKGKIKGVALVDQIRSVDWKARNARKSGEASHKTMKKIKELLELII